MIIQDTNLFSELIRRKPDDNVLAWYSQYSNDDLTLTAITVGELLYGVNRMPPGTRQQTLSHLIVRQLLPFADRILPFDNFAARHYAQIKIDRQRMGKPISEQDAMIAAIARSHGMALATRNVKDFEGTGVKLINPWESQTSS